MGQLRGAAVGRQHGKTHPVCPQNLASLVFTMLLFASRYPNETSVQNRPPCPVCTTAGCKHNASCRCSHRCCAAAASLLLLLPPPPPRCCCCRAAAAAAALTASAAAPLPPLLQPACAPAALLPAPCTRDGAPPTSRHASRRCRSTTQRGSCGERGTADRTRWPGSMTQDEPSGLNAREAPLPCSTCPPAPHAAGALPCCRPALARHVGAAQVGAGAGRSCPGRCQLPL